MNAATFALIAGSIVVFIQTAILIFVVDTDATTFFAAAAISYIVIGTPALLYFRDPPGECTGNRIERRRDLVLRAEESHRTALTDLEAKTQLAEEARQAWLSSKEGGKKAA